MIGAGPAGLTAALEACRRGFHVTVLEANDQVGGLATTVVRGGNRFDVGGHRFFTKFPRVGRWWSDVLDNDLITVQRQSRIYYRGKFFDYPLRIGNVLKGLGLPESLRIAGSYGWAKLHPRRPASTFEDWGPTASAAGCFTFFSKVTRKKSGAFRVINFRRTGRRSGLNRCPWGKRCETPSGRIKEKLPR